MNSVHTQGSTWTPQKRHTSIVRPERSRRVRARCQHLTGVRSTVGRQAGVATKPATSATSGRSGAGCAPCPGARPARDARRPRRACRTPSASDNQRAWPFRSDCTSGFRGSGTSPAARLPLAWPMSAFARGRRRPGSTGSKLGCSRRRTTTDRGRSLVPEVSIQQDTRIDSAGRFRILRWPARTAGSSSAGMDSVRWRRQSGGPGRGFRPLTQPVPYMARGDRPCHGHWDSAGMILDRATILSTPAGERRTRSAIARRLNPDSRSSTTRASSARSRGRPNTTPRLRA